MNSNGEAEVRLPDPVAELVDGHSLDRKVGPTITLTATGDDLWPRQALLSVGEVLSMSGVDIRLALYGGSRTTAALSQSGRALLSVVLDGMSYKILAEVERIAHEDGPLAYFYGHVTAVDEDHVGYAKITSGLTFELIDGQATLDRWDAQVDRLGRIAP